MMLLTYPVSAQVTISGGKDSGESSGASSSTNNTQKKTNKSNSNFFEELDKLLKVVPMPYRRRIRLQA